jgi:hypothetical protein
LGRNLAPLGGFVLVTVCYVTLRWLLQFMALCVRSTEFKELEIIVLRHELGIASVIHRKLT